MRSNRLSAAALAAGLALAVSQYFIWVHAPIEQTMGLVQKIFYFHLAVAWWSLMSFFVVFAAGIGFLFKRTSGWDHAAGAAAEIGVLFSALALTTGTLWARASWGVWWTWDPRLTTTLIMWFVYCSYLILRASGLGEERRAMICAVVGIVAFLDVPLVFLSARMWRSIHPAVFKSKGGGLEPEMLTAVFVTLAAFGLLWICLVMLRFRQFRMREKIKTLLAAHTG